MTTHTIPAWLPRTTQAAWDELEAARRALSYATWAYNAGQPQGRERREYARTRYQMAARAVAREEVGR